MRKLLAGVALAAVMVASQAHADEAGQRLLEAKIAQGVELLETIKASYAKNPTEKGSEMLAMAEQAVAARKQQLADLQADDQLKADIQRAKEQAHQELLRQQAEREAAAEQEANRRMAQAARQQQAARQAAPKPTTPTPQVSNSDALAVRYQMCLQGVKKQAEENRATGHPMGYELAKSLEDNAVENCRKAAALVHSILDR